MCSGCRKHICWLGVTVDGPLAAKKISLAVFAAIASLKDFDPVFRVMVNDEAQKLDQVRDRSIKDAQAQLAKLKTEGGNIMAFIKAQGANASSTLMLELTGLEKRQAEVKADLDDLLAQPAQTIEIPSAEVIKKVAREAFAGLAAESLEFARLLRQLIPRIVVFPYRLVDGGDIVLRATFRLHLANLLPDTRVRAALAGPLERVITVDLFDPPQREQFRAEVVRRRKAGESERKAAEALGLTVTAAQRAMALQRKMDAMGLTEPYVKVTEPPDDCPRLRRHKHGRYRFDPLPDAGTI
jgi:hypothetical protein